MTRQHSRRMRAAHLPTVSCCIPYLRRGVGTRGGGGYVQGWVDTPEVPCPGVPTPWTYPPPRHTNASGHTHPLDKPSHRHTHLWTYPSTLTYPPLDILTPDIPTPDIPDRGKDMGPEIPTLPVNRQTPVKTLPSRNLFGGR